MCFFWEEFFFGGGAGEIQKKIIFINKIHKICFNFQNNDSISLKFCI